MDSELSPEVGHVDALTLGFIDLQSGGKIDENELELPLRFTVMDKPWGGSRIADYYSGSDLWSKRLLSIVQSAGVDNLQVLPAEIMKVPADFELGEQGGTFPPEATGEVVRDWVVVNIVGSVSCADVGASDSSPLADVSYFHKLVVSPAQTGGLKIFRLAECPGDIIVSKEVAEAITAANFTDVSLEPLEESSAE